MLLGLREDIETVGEAGTGTEVVGVTRETRHDVVIMDVHMPGLNGIEATRLIMGEFLDIGVLVLTIYDDDTVSPRCTRVREAFS